jgi:glycosyltransferase involved in cell wall biosynthesis
MFFSIVVPTYNEQDDIAGTIRALVEQTYDNFEVIVVDDSTDSTAEIVFAFEDPRVRLLCPLVKDGRCGARNLGVLEARGELLVILNADVRPQRDFLEQLVEEYESGADYVLVSAMVSNQARLFPRYVQAMASYLESGDKSWMYWTEGYSVRRNVAMKTPLFPAGYFRPISAGEDGVFGRHVAEVSRKRVERFDIVVHHIAPASLTEYWGVRVGRGEGSAEIRRIYYKEGYLTLSVKSSVRLFKSIIDLILPISPLILIMRIQRHSRFGIADLIPFYLAYIIEKFAFNYGEISTIFQMYRYERSIRCAKK